MPPLNPEERERLGLPADEEQFQDLDEMPKSGRLDKRRSAKTIGFGEKTGEDIKSLRKLIDESREAGLIDEYEASIHRMFLALLEEPGARVGERMKAIENLARLRGLFVQRIRQELETPRDRPTHELLRALADKLGVEIPETGPKFESPASAIKRLGLGAKRTSIET